VFSTRSRWFVCGSGAWATALLALGVSAGWADDGEPPRPELRLAVSNQTVRVDWTPYPAAARYELTGAQDPSRAFATVAGGVSGGYFWSGSVLSSLSVFRVRVEPVAPDVLLASIGFNRLAYGPTPDEIDRVLTGPQAIGAEAYIAEQLAPEGIAEDLDAPLPELGWQFVSLTGVASSSTLYLYPDAAGEVYLDDLSLVAGTVSGVGAEFIKDGGFESPLAASWTLSSNLANSEITGTVKRSGNSSLRLVASAGGTTRASSIWQTLSPALTVGRTYTLSYWYLPSTNGNNLTVRLSGSGDYPGTGIDTTHSLVPAQYLPGVVYGKLAAGSAGLTDLRAWHALHAVRSKRQWLRVALDFTDNHFTTQYAKSRDYLDGQLTNSVTPGRTATDLEFRELLKWQAVWLDPNGTFHDLLKVSAESPAMIIYLDTVTSAGGNANENYSRELVELFTLGVDNGYDQTDIEQMSRAWTGWRVAKMPLAEANNPFATPVANADNDPGVWTLRFRTSRHDTGAKTIFKGKTIDARFGPPHAGKSYQLDLPARSGNSGMQDGYDLLRHLADLPYTQEYLSVKLCRLLVHEDFHHGLYDYRDPNLSPEGRLIAACLAAWESPGPDGRKGNLRQVVRAIVSSDLFRRHAASQQKVKTPFEHVVSTVRALRAARPGGGFTADTDGYDVLTALSRLNQRMFDRTDPDGWPEAGREWVSTATLVERMRFAQNFLIAAREPLKAVDFGTTGDDNVSDPVAVLKLRLPAAGWRDPAAVATLFLRLFCLGEGEGNLVFDRDAAVEFLNSNDTGAPQSSPFHLLDPDSSPYDRRVRGMVAFLLCLPRFQEQ
jgi:hypothetical protein